MTTPVKAIAIASFVTSFAFAAHPVRAAASLPPGFDSTVVTDSLVRPTDLEFAPDGRLFVAEQAGRVRIVRADGTLATFLNLSTKVDSTNERGLSSIAFDPNFTSNRFVYLNYTREATATAAAHNRVVRVTASGNRAVAGSEQLILRLNDQDNTHHIGGAIDFGADGKLYISTGDGVGGPTQTLGNFLGKMLRINKGGSIPATNPFYDTATGKLRAIWALGLRNPFKFAVDPDSGAIHINDVGQDTWEEIDLGRSGANYGWAIYEGLEDDPDFDDPVFAYRHDGDVATTGCSITGGAFYSPPTNQFPREFVGDYFFADFCSGWIRTFDRATGEADGFLSGSSGIVDIEVDADGTLHYLSRTVPASVHAVGYSAP